MSDKCPPFVRGGQQVVCHDEEDAGTADADVAGSQGHSLGGGLHQHRDAARKTDHHNEEHGGEKGKHDGRTADDRADELRLFLTQIPGNEDRDAHGQLGDDLPEPESPVMTTSFPQGISRSTFLQVMHPRTEYFDVVFFHDE